MRIVLILLLISFSFFPALAERVKGSTLARPGIGDSAQVQFADSASVYPYEPVQGKYRLVMWVGYVERSALQGDTLIKAGTNLQGKDFTPCGKAVSDFKLPYFEDAFFNNYPQLKKVVLYLYILDSAIIAGTRVEQRLEKILAEKKDNKKHELFTAFMADFGFTGGQLTEKYHLYFIYDERSPEGHNDFRLLVFTDNEKRIVAVANNGYRPLQLKPAAQAPLDRELVIYYVAPLPEEDRAALEKQFIESYKYRD